MIGAILPRILRAQLIMEPNTHLQIENPINIDQH